RIDFRETESSYQIFAEVPGLDEKDIDIELHEDTLTIKGEKKFEQEKSKDDHWHFERSFGSFHRAIHIPTEVNHEKISAKYKNGVLTIDLPKAPEAKSKAHKIKVN